MTPKHKLDYIKQWRIENRQKVLAYRKRYYSKNKDRYSKWKADNPDRVKASRVKNANKSKQRTARWIANNKHRHNEWRRTNYRFNTESISEYYVRKLIARHSGWNFAAKLPIEFIKAKQAHIKLLRLCQNQPTSKN